MTTIDPLTYLDEVDARAEAATEGPWVPYSTGSSPMDNYVTTPGLDGVAMHYALAWKPGDAEFIAHARQDLPALSKALRAVLAMHIPHTGFGDDPPICRECNRVALGATVEAYYPCPTVRAIQAALAVNDEGGKK